VANLKIVQAKEAKVNELIEKFGKAQAVILTSYIGITVEEDTELRKKLREAGVEYKVIKNSMTSRATKALGFDVDEYLAGPVAIAVSYDDATAPARILAEFGEKHKAIDLKAGIVQGQVFDTAKVKELSKVPPREVLIAKFLGSIKSPISNLAYVLDAIRKSKEEASA
jgi:large subunit ribosomal protein L10